MGDRRMRLPFTFAAPRLAAQLAAPSVLAGGPVDPFAVQLYEAGDPPATPALTDLPELSSVTQHGITWTFAAPARVGRFVNGDYYVVGETTISAIDPEPTTGQGVGKVRLLGRARPSFVCWRRIIVVSIKRACEKYNLTKTELILSYLNIVCLDIRLFL